MGRTNEADRDQEDRRSRDDSYDRGPDRRRRPAGAIPAAGVDVEGKGLTGRVKTLVADKGFGFVDGDNGVQYFFHHSVCLPTGRGAFDHLTEGERVAFDGIKSPKGPRCETLSSLDKATDAEKDRIGNRI